MKETTFKKGNSVFLSDKGHNGFFYPSEKKANILYDTMGVMPPWIGGGDNKKVFLVPENAIVFSGDPLKCIPVWVETSEKSE